MSNVVWIIDKKLYRDSKGDLHETVEAAKERLDVYGTFIERGLRSGTLKWRKNPKNGVVQVYGEIPNYAKGRNPPCTESSGADKETIVKWVLFWLCMILSVLCSVSGQAGGAFVFIFVACGILFVGSLIDGSMARAEAAAKNASYDGPVYGLDYGIGDSVWNSPSFDAFRDEVRDMVSNR